LWLALLVVQDLKKAMASFFGISSQPKFPWMLVGHSYPLSATELSAAGISQPHSRCWNRCGLGVLAHVACHMRVPATSCLVSCILFMLALVLALMLPLTL